MEITVVGTREQDPNVQPFLVDVPVKTNVWVRPECQKAQFEVLRQARPSILIVQSDGGRNDEEWKLIRENRRLFDERVDWDCTVHKLYAEKNYGLYEMGRQTREYIWSEVDRCIYLEDDHIPSVCFFRFCAELLEKYKDDLRVTAICGMNHLGVYDRPTTDYFFSHVGSIWGVAMWKRTVESYGLDYKEDPYVIDEVCNIAKKDTVFCECMKGYAEGKLVGGHVPGSEFYLSLNMFAQNQLFIVPSKNMISCHGVGSGSTHATDSLKKMSKGDAQFFYMKTYELDGEIRHPGYVFPDLTYEKRMKRVTAWHHPIIHAYRRIVGIIKRVYYGDGKIMLKKLEKKLRGEKHIET